MNMQRVDSIGVKVSHGSLLTFWRFTNRIIIIIIIEKAQNPFDMIIYLLFVSIQVHL